MNNPRDLPAPAESAESAPATPAEKLAPEPADNAVNDAPQPQPQPAPAAGETALTWQDDTEKQGEGDSDKAEAKEGAKEGEEDEYVFTPPEGYRDDGETTEEFRAILREGKVDRETAQKLYELAPKLTSRFTDRLLEQIAERSDEWNGQLRADPEYGGGRYDRTVDDARHAIKLMAPGLIPVINEYQLGNCPPLVKHFADLGKANREGRSPKPEPLGTVRASSPLVRRKEEILARSEGGDEYASF